MDNSILLSAQSTVILLKLNTSRIVQDIHLTVNIGIRKEYGLDSALNYQLYWESTFPLYRLRYKKYISLPGNNMYLSQMRLNKTIPKTETLTVVWIHDNYMNHKLASQTCYKNTRT